jgi:hypothetical protein
VKTRYQTFWDSAKGGEIYSCKFLLKKNNTLAQKDKERKRERDR